MLNLRYMFFSGLMAWGVFSLFEDSGSDIKFNETEINIDSMQQTTSRIQPLVVFVLVQEY